MFDVGVENYFDPVYQSWISRRPVGRGMFYIQDPKMTVFVQGMNNILASNEINHLHYIHDEPFLAISYPSANYSAFSHLVGSLYLSGLILAKVRVKEDLFLLEWFIENGLWEEFLVCQVLRHLIKLPGHRILSKLDGFSKILKKERINILKQIINGKGEYFEHFVSIYKNLGSKPPKIHSLKDQFDQLSNGLQIDRVFSVLEGKSDIANEAAEDIEEKRGLSVLHLFEGGSLCLSHLDRVFRLVFYTGQRTGMSHVEALFNMLNISFLGDRIKEVSLTDEAMNQIVNLLLTFYRDLNVKVLGHPIVTYYRTLLKQSVEAYIGDSPQRTLELFKQILFRGDYHLYKILQESDIPRAREFIGRILFKIPYDDCIETRPFSKTEVLLENLISIENKINKEGNILMATHFADAWYDKWLDLDNFVDANPDATIRKVRDKDKFKKLFDRAEKYKNDVRIMFFSLKKDKNFKDKVDTICIKDLKLELE